MSTARYFLMLFLGLIEIRILIKSGDLIKLSASFTSLKFL